MGAIIIGMICASIILAIFLIFLTSRFPKCIIISGTFLIYLVLIAILVLSIINRVWPLAGIIAGFIAIITCLLYCYR